VPGLLGLRATSAVEVELGLADWTTNGFAISGATRKPAVVTVGPPNERREATIARATTVDQARP
jgi:hypothetical protein